MKFETRVPSLMSASLVRKIIRTIYVFIVLLAPVTCFAQAENPIIFADVPDAAMIRVGGNYYLSSTTMHMNPGVPIMKSTDLVNWKLLNLSLIHI